MRSIRYLRTPNLTFYRKRHLTNRFEIRSIDRRCTHQAIWSPLPSYIPFLLRATTPTRFRTQNRSQFFRPPQRRGRRIGPMDNFRHVTRRHDRPSNVCRPFFDRRSMVFQCGLALGGVLNTHRLYRCWLRRNSFDIQKDETIVDNRRCNSSFLEYLTMGDFIAAFFVLG